MDFVNAFPGRSGTIDLFHYGYKKNVLSARVSE
jgi:hypothetical protein